MQFSDHSHRAVSENVIAVAVATLVFLITCVYLVTASIKSPEKDSTPSQEDEGMASNYNRVFYMKTFIHLPSFAGQIDETTGEQEQDEDAREEEVEEPEQKTSRSSDRGRSSKEV